MRTQPRRPDRSSARLVMAALALALATCSPHNEASVSAPIGPDASERLCSRLGFAPGTGAFASCIAELDGLERQQASSQRQCEGIRQRGLSTPFTSGGIGNTIATSDADYQACMSGQLIPPAQLPLPTGRTTTCRVIRDEIVCN